MQNFRGTNKEYYGIFDSGEGLLILKICLFRKIDLLTCLKSRENNPIAELHVTFDMGTKPCIETFGTFGKRFPGKPPRFRDFWEHPIRPALFITTSVKPNY